MLSPSLVVEGFQGRSRSRSTISAFFPTSMEPVSFSNPSACAPPSVAISNTEGASIAVGPCAGFWIRAASRISWNMFSVLLHGAPSAPRETMIPFARSSGTRAIPDPSFRLDEGQWATFARRSWRRSISRSFSQIQCARQVLECKMPIDSKNSTLSSLHRFLTASISCRFSAA